MNSRYLELICLFILLPISLTLTIPIQAKFAVSIIGIVYAMYIAYKEGILKRSELFHLNGKEYWKTIWYRLIPTSLVLLAIIFFYDKSLLFKVLINKPGLFFIIILVYTFFSVFPQELIYRVFFIKRYSHFFKKEWVLILVNALLFSLAHIMFLNPLVSILTFVGGIIFSITYLRTNSYLMTSIEHTLYGLWLFTLGVGDMLAFPS